MKNKVISILFAGVGGQGILKASEICGVAAMLAGYEVKKSEIRGISQRFGSVESHLRYGKEVYSPIIPLGKADFLVCLHKEEEQRFINYLGKKGINLTSFLDLASKNLKNPRLLNTFMLGVLSSYLELREKYWIKSIELNFPEKYVEMNLQAFKLGRKLALNQKKQSQFQIVV
ncbi:MAG TPA: pyruvate ferredoxin oxidoreductase [Candidatus Altiarchaeales archaeon]|nr:pyruvate ferredoxin oxidoreductase [Candidatus Altiarchaeales archaeon]